jgi:hypothetical protein
VNSDSEADLTFKEGTWFAVPLSRKSFAVGRVARLSREGVIILAYIFRPARNALATLAEVEHLEPCEACKIFRMSGIGLIDRSWPIIGDSARWERDRWPIPDFSRKDELTRTAWRVAYSDYDPSVVVSEQRIPPEKTGLERDCLLGHKAAEIVLSNHFEVTA